MCGVGGEGGGEGARVLNDVPRKQAPLTGGKNRNRGKEKTNITGIIAGARSRRGNNNKKKRNVT